MEAEASLRSPFTIQSIGGPLVARLSFSLDRGVGLVSHLTDGAPVPEGVGETLRSAYADVLVLDHGLFAAAWTSVADSTSLVAEHDRLVKAALATYAPERIVLLRSSIRRFYWAGNAVLPRRHPDDGRDIEALRRFVADLDKRFQQATGCVVVEAESVHLPTKDTVAHDSGLSEDAILAVEDAVLAAVRAGAPPPPIPAPPLDSAFAAGVQLELLGGGIGPARVLELLPDSGLDTHDDVAALAAAFVTDRDADWSAVAVKALPTQGVVWEAMRRRIESNIQTLRDHPHVYIPGALNAASGIAAEARLVSRLSRSWFLLIDPDRPRPIQQLNYGRRGTFDVQGCCDAGYVCAPSQIDTALESWEAYFERGRRGDTAPFRIAFPNRAEFRLSLAFLDYADILDNENYCLTVNGRIPAGIRWRARVDTSFLFDPRTRVCMLGGGIGDQVYRYVYAQTASERHGFRLFVDDLWFDYPDVRMRWAHARPDVLRLVRSEGVMSELVSRRLRQRRRTRPHHIRVRSEYAELGLVEQVLIVERSRLRHVLERNRDFDALVVAALTPTQLDRAMVSPPPGVIFSDVIAKHRWLTEVGGGDKVAWERCVAWPQFLSAGAAAVAEHMLASDAVVVHVRRGDRVELGIADPDDYYRRFLERVAALDEFPNKHTFVFSDDLDYCRQHPRELGLDLMGDRMTFVEGNRHFASIDDFHLVSLGKVIVCGRSGFGAAAARLSTRVEYVFGDESGAGGGDTWKRALAGRDPGPARQPPRP